MFYSSLINVAELEYILNDVPHLELGWKQPMNQHQKTNFLLTRCFKERDGGDRQFGIDEGGGEFGGEDGCQTVILIFVFSGSVSTKNYRSLSIY